MKYMCNNCYCQTVEANFKQYPTCCGAEMRPIVYRLDMTPEQLQFFINLIEGTHTRTPIAESFFHYTWLEMKEELAKALKGDQK